MREEIEVFKSDDMQTIMSTATLVADALGLDVMRLTHIEIATDAIRIQGIKEDA